MTVRTRFAAAVVALGMSCSAQAEIYIAVDADGAITLTDVRRGSEYVRVDTGPALSPKGALAMAAGLPFAALVSAAAAEHALPEALLHAVIRAESNYNPAAVSPKGAMGLMQLMPATARELGVVDAHDPAANIRGGAQYLKQLLGMFDNNTELAVAAYNAGPGAVQRSGGGIPPYAETRRYVPRVMDHFHRLQAAADPSASARR